VNERYQADRRLLLVVAVLVAVVSVAYLAVGLSARSWQYALSLRIPKLLAMMVTGAAIAFSTVTFQTITNNRILTPSIMGLDSLYLLVQSVVVYLFGSASELVVNPKLNFLIVVAAMVAFAVVLYALLFRSETRDLMFLLLVGVILGTLFESGASFVQMVIDPNEFSQLQNKMFASFNNMNTGILWVAGLILAATLVGTIRHLSTLDVLALGREHALNLGVPYEQVVRRLLIVVAVLVSVSTGLVGPIMFLGLLVANLARELLKTYLHKYLLVGASLISILALVGGQFLAERVFNFATPISVLINLAGGLYFILLLLKESRA
jgi:iron complex transport system permease protein